MKYKLRLAEKIVTATEMRRAYYEIFKNPTEKEIDIAFKNREGGEFAEEDYLLKKR